MQAQFSNVPLTPSPICLGTAELGSAVDRDRCFVLFDTYLELGGNFLDTAHIYSAWLEGGVGTSERTVGAWIRSRGVRDQVVLATKGGHPPLDAPDTNIGLLSPSDLQTHLAESLDRLGLDRVDLYYLHRDEPARPIGEIVETLAGLVRGGGIRAWGVSNWGLDRIEQAIHYAQEQHLPPPVANEPFWSFAVAAERDELQAWHTRTGLAMAPYTSQAKGYFGAANAAWAAGGFQGPPPRAADYDSPTTRRRLQRAMDLAERKGLSPNQIALAFLLSQPFPVFPIIGTGTLDHLREAMGAADLHLTEEETRALIL